MADEPATSPQIFTYLDGRIPVRCHEHIAIVHRGGEAAGRGVEFLAEGLQRGHWCCCCAPEASHTGILARLGELGVDVERHLDNQTLQLPYGARHAGHLLDGPKQFFNQAEVAGALAVRWLEEGVWAQSAAISKDKFFELHSLLNYLVKQYLSVALCHYDTERLETGHLFSAIAVHRHLLVLDTLVRDNPFYIPPEKYLGMNQEDRERDLRSVFREVGFDLGRLLSTLAGYGQLQSTGS